MTSSIKSDNSYVKEYTLNLNLARKASTESQRLYSSSQFWGLLANFCCSKSAKERYNTLVAKQQELNEKCSHYHVLAIRIKNAQFKSN